MKIDIVDNTPNIEMTPVLVKDFISELQSLGVKISSNDESNTSFELSCEKICINIWLGEVSGDENDFSPSAYIYFFTKPGDKQTYLFEKIDDSSGNILPFSGELTRKQQTDLVLAYIMNFLDELAREKIYMGTIKKKPAAIYKMTDCYRIAYKKWFMHGTKPIKDLDTTLQVGNFEPILLSDLQTSFKHKDGR